MKNVFFFIAPLMGLALIAEIMLRSIPNDYALKRNYMEQHSTGLHGIILGNSSSYAGINPAFLHKKTFNLAYVSQTWNYDYELLRKYIGNCDSLEFIVLSVSYPSLVFSLGSGDIEDWRIKNYTMYYGIHNTLNLPYYTELLSNRMNFNIDRLWSYYADKKSPITCSPEGWGIKFNSSVKSDMTDLGKKIAVRQTRLDTAAVPTNIDFLDSIVALASGRKAKVLLLTLPGFHTLTDNMNMSQLNRVKEVSRGMENKYQNCRYLDMLTDSSFSETDFYDPGHLNEIGAKKLTLKIDAFLTNWE